MRAVQSEYMHWAKNQAPVTYALSSSEVPHFRLDRLPIAIADLELDGASYHRYPPLRRAIAEKEGVDPASVVMADGTSMANFLALAALIEPGDEVVVEFPVYEPLIAAARFLGAEVKRFERPGFALDPAAVERALSPATKLVILTNLHNPSGAYASPEQLAAVGALGPLVLVDEVYLDSGPRPGSAFHLGPNFVCTSSLTKVYGLSGLRCGWILAERDLAERMWRLNELMGVAQAHPAERLSCFALAHLGEIAAGREERLERNRALFNAFLASRGDLDCMVMQHGITAFPRLLSGDPEALNALLRERFDTAIVPGKWFEMPDRFRVGVGGATEMVEEGLARLGQALDMLA
jgi:aspartate/methionine/tyrosine aminotransferase